jgi:hypothetical protein
MLETHCTNRKAFALVVIFNGDAMRSPGPPLATIAHPRRPEKVANIAMNEGYLYKGHVRILL